MNQHLTQPTDKIQLEENILGEEQVLVIQRSILFNQENAWKGLKKVDETYYLRLIRQHQEFFPRYLMEQDTHYKQIIPYLIFEHQDHYFLMQRTAKTTEARLKNKLSLGIGGHINPDDIKNGTIIDWARREFHEEVSYNGNLTTKFLGIINDDSNAVGQVHVGFVYLLKGDSPDIRIKEEHKSGDLISLSDCIKQYDLMESWSQMVIQTLKDQAISID